MVKIISISDEVYMQLSGIKNGRSFTKVIAALLEENKKGKKADLGGMEKFFGVIDGKTAAAWQKEIDLERKRFGKSRG